MACSLIEVEMSGGLPRLLCPVSGKVIFDWKAEVRAEGDLGPYFRFYVDEFDDPIVAVPGSLGKEVRETQDRLIEILSSDWESQNEMIAACTQVMPKSAVVFEILDPPGGGGHSGSIHYVAFDFSQAHESPQSVVALPLEDVETSAE